MLVSIVYSNATSQTARQASAVADGVRGVPGVECRLVNLSSGAVPWDALETSGAIIFGSPARGGTVDAEVKQFFENSTAPVWLRLAWRDKVAAGLTNSGARPGDERSTLVTMASFAAQHGMVWVGVDLPQGSDRTALHDRIRHGGGLGAMARSNDAPGSEEIDVERGLRMAAYLGHRVARIARRMDRRT